MSIDGHVRRALLVCAVVLTATGCGGGGGTSPVSTVGGSTGTVNSGTAGQYAYYATTGSTLSGTSSITANAITSTAAAEICTLAALSTSNTATQNSTALSAAITASLTASGGRVCLPGSSSPYPWQTYTLSVSGVSILGQRPIQHFLYNQPDLGYRLSGGTVLQGTGAGAGAAFYYVGPGGSAST